MPTAEIRSFYDRWSELFLERCDSLFQASLPYAGPTAVEDPRSSIVYMAERASISPGERVLDAGCGVGGPALVIANEIPEVIVDGVTISETQVRIGGELIEDAGMADRVRLHVADFHALPFADHVFDVAIFLEVTNYSYERKQMFSEAVRVLRPGGRIYIKDVFRPESTDPIQQADLEAFQDMWACVRTPTLSETVTAMSRAGFLNVEVREYPYLSANRFIGSMFDIAGGRLVPNELGKQFLRVFHDLPVFYREIRASTPEL